MSVSGFRLDVEKFKQEARKLGHTTICDIASAAGVSARTVHRAMSGAERPSQSLLLWLVECGVDVRRVWTDA